MFTEWYEVMVRCKLCTHGNACSLVLFVGVDFVSGLGKIFEVFGSLRWVGWLVGWFVSGFIQRQ